MLEIKNLTKVYKPKKGVPVKAIDNISLIFPENGMVFLLGKSGSGKSTLLNLLGGLDKYDEGEIIIKGVSTKNFRQGHFDSYRNTYVGFIFQEYNILDEFTVGANIALAIELQGRKASDEEINRILCEVDLDGYGDRKPGELSGGQKQRVAIARALVKNPEIIMADEPTGALDSTTGTQVLDTLKKLSAKKLVIVVSHDREFAMRYADRIIELSDGHVISDVTRQSTDEKAAESANAENLTFSANTVSVKKGYHLTEEDRCRINEYIDSIDAGVVLELEKDRGAAAAGEFAATDVEKTKTAKPEGAEAFRLIKSKLPLKSAFKIGAGGLKYKKIRLVITILLSCISFGLFGLADTFGAYNHVTACTDSIMDSGINYASFSKNVEKGEGDARHRVSYATMTEDDIKLIDEKFGIDTVGVYAPLSSRESFDFSARTDTDTLFADSKGDYHINPTSFSGIAEINETILGKMGAKILCGTLPNGTKNEVAVSEYVYETFNIGGYVGADGKTEKISRPADLLGKTVSVAGKDFTITAVVDTGVDTSRYSILKENTAGDSNADKLVKYALAEEYGSMITYSLTGVAMVGSGSLDSIAEAKTPVGTINDGWVYFFDSSGDGSGIDATYMTTLDKVKGENIVWANGEKTALGERELIISDDLASESGADPTEFFGKAFDSSYGIWKNGYYTGENDSGYKIVGYYKTDENSSDMKKTVICSEEIFDRFTTGINGRYFFAVGAMPAEKSEVRSVVDGCVNPTDTVGFNLQNAATFELDSVNSILKSVSRVFFWIGVGFAVFAGIMLSNFIATSISHKKQEIGILRAIGSRGADVFRIFFSESLIIALVNFVLSAVGVGVATAIINHVIRTEMNVLITVLHFGVRQIGLLFVLSIAIAALASFFPVKRIASKKPIDAIRNR